MNSFQKPSLSAEIGWSNSVQPASNTVAMIVRTTQSFLFKPLPPKPTIQIYSLENIVPCKYVNTLLNLPNLFPLLLKNDEFRK